MSFDTALTKAQQSVPECLAVGYVEMSTGMLLGVKTVDSHPPEILDLVAAATADLFQGQSVTSIEKMFRKSRGQTEDGRHYFKEVIIVSDHLVHIFLRGKDKTDQALVFVCRSTASIGMVLTKSRQCLREVEDAV